MRPHLFLEPDLPHGKELERLTDYVGGFMSEADEAAFDEQLASDEAFYHRMAPMLKVWYVRTLPPSIMQAGVRLNQRLADTQRRAIDRRRAWGVTLTRAAAAALVIFGAVETGVVQFAFRGHADVGPTLAQAPVRRLPSSEPAQNPQAPAHGAPAAVAITAVKRRATHRSIRVDSAAERRVAELVTAPLPSEPVMPPLPSLRFTPGATVVAQSGEIILRGSPFVAGPRALGNDIRFQVPPARGNAPGDNATPGTGFHFPWIIIEPWRWFNH
jgi:hypothetical protein